MRNRVIRKIISALLFTCIGLFIFYVRVTFAASTTVGPSPESGSYGKPFTIYMVIDGHGDKFNAAQATVSLSSGLKIQDLTFGDCNFSFLRTPSIQNPSFAGVIISTYSTKCTVYTATLVPVAKGQEKVMLSNASVKRYGDAANILSITNNGDYMLTGTAQSATDMMNTSKPGLYTLYLKVTKADSSVPNTTVSLAAVSSKNNQQAATDNSGTAHFLNLQPGIYNATVMQEGSKVGETIINVSGANHVLTFGIDLSTQKSNPLMKAKATLATYLTNPLFLIAALIAGIILGVGIALFVIKLLNKSKI